MDEKGFVEFVSAEAQRHETEALQQIVSALSDIVRHRITGKPQGLRRGSIVHATTLGSEEYRFGHVYGEVVSISGKSCMVQEPGDDRLHRVWFSKCAIEFIPDNEWRYMEERVRTDNEERAARVEKQMRETYGDDYAQLSDEEFEERDAAVLEQRRAKSKR